MPQPVVLFAVCVDRILYALRKPGLEPCINRLLRAFDHPLQDVAAGLLKKEIRIILDVAVTDDLRIEGDYDQPAPDTVIISPDLRKMVGIKDQRVARNECKRRLVLLFSENLIRRAKLLHHRGIEPHSFFHLGSDDQTLTLKLRHFRLHIPLVSDRQGLRRQLAAVGAKHP